jgi:hypothetical protein
VKLTPASFRSSSADRWLVAPMPAVPKFASPFRLRSQARKLGTSVAGTLGCTTTAKG